MLDALIPSKIAELALVTFSVAGWGKIIRFAWKKIPVLPFTLSQIESVHVPFAFCPLNALRL